MNPTQTAGVDASFLDEVESTLRGLVAKLDALVVPDAPPGPPLAAAAGSALDRLDRALAGWGGVADLTAAWADEAEADLLAGEQGLRDALKIAGTAREAVRPLAGV